jgi:glutamate synthase (NADPH/NADH) large chain
MSKMGISTMQSYRGAQIFEAVGLDRALVDKHFTGTPVARSGRGPGRARARGAERTPRLRRPAIEPTSTRCRWAATTSGAGAASARWNPHHRQPCRPPRRRRARQRFADLRGDDERTRLIDPARAARAGAAGGPVPLDEVEPASEIVKRFATGAMSFGSISAEAHETLAIAMNRLGGRSNSGEGGEEPRRYTPDDNGDAPQRDQAGRVGALRRHGEYLVNADELQIKIAQGAKPGEGGQLPGHKVDERIAGALLDAGRDAHLAAAAPRHLLDRGPGAAHLRPEDRQPERASA